MKVYVVLYECCDWPVIKVVCATKELAISWITTNYPNAQYCPPRAMYKEIWRVDKADDIIIEEVEYLT